MNKKPHQRSNISGNQKYRTLFKKEIPPAKGGKKVNFFFFFSVFLRFIRSQNELKTSGVKYHPSRINVTMKQNIFKDYKNIF